MSAALIQYGSTIVRRDGDFFSLTDMWRAEGSPEHKRPVDWSRFEGASFIEFIGDSLKVSGAHFDCIRTLRGGNNPGTWGHWQVALAYAKYLSPKFHAWCNEIVRAHLADEKAASTPALPSTGHHSLLAACQTVGQNPLWQREIFQRLGYAAHVQKTTWSRAEGALRRHLGVVSYKRVPANMLDETRRYIDSMVEGRTSIARRPTLRLIKGGGGGSSKQVPLFD